jgi:nucleoside-diphosphate-sugar epimerase
MSSSKRVLVTGGGGYIGVCLVGELLTRGYEVRVVDRLFWGERPISHLRDRIDLVVADVRSPEADWFRDVSAVVHLAGLSNDPTAEYNPEANWQMNAVATERLAKMAKELGVSRFTFGSSCSVYDGLEPGPVYDEDAPLQPRGAYAISKQWAEDRLLELADGSFQPVLLRQGTVYGFSPRMRYDLVVNTFVKDALDKGRLLLHGGGCMWRPLVEVRDVAAAHIACLEAPAERVAGQIFNVVHDNHQIRQLAMLVGGAVQLWGRPVTLQVTGEVPAIVRDYRCSNHKIRQAIGFEPRITVLDSIEHMLSQLPLDGYMNFGHPRFYNIEWMTLLVDATATQRTFASVF